MIVPPGTAFPISWAHLLNPNNIKVSEGNPVLWSLSWKYLEEAGGRV